MWRKEDVLKLIEKDKADNSLREYGKIVGCSAMYIHDVLKGARTPSQKLLDRVGLEKHVTRTVTYKPKKKWRKDGTT